MKLFKRQNGIYYIKIVNENGKEKRISTKCKKKKDALQFLTNYKLQLNKPEEVKIYFLKDVVQNYLSSCQKRFTPKYYSIMKYTLIRFEHFCGNIEVENITSQVCEKFIMEKYSSAKFMANLLYRNTKTFFRWAVENEYLVDSPIRKIKPPKVPTKNPEWLTENDLEIVLKKVKNKNLIPIYKLLFYTGLRANERLSLHWSNVDLAVKIISIKNENGFQTKTQIDKILPINEKAFKIFANLYQLNDYGLVFIKNGIKLNVDYVSKQFKKAIKETNLNQNLHLHSLRHSFASNLIANGASLYHVSKLLSHSRISTTEKYSHVNMKELREAAENL